jgi:hypothetical protein
LSSSWRIEVIKVSRRVATATVAGFIVGYLLS